MFKETLTKGYHELFKETMPTRQLDQFTRFKDLLLVTNEKMNLTAITEENEIAIKHFLDSLTPLTEHELLLKEGRMIDVGTGAGFPGIPLKIVAPHLEITLLDSLNKRVGFLKQVISELGLEKIYTIHGRAEDLGRDPDYREQFDYAVSRAVAKLPVLLEYTLPFVKPGGYLICQKGPGVKDELNEGKKALMLLGGEIERIIEVDLPFVERGHHLILIKKIKKTPKKYPRQAGKPAKKPL